MKTATTVAIDGNNLLSIRRPAAIISIVTFAVALNVFGVPAEASEQSAPYKFLSAGEIKPSGWIREQMKNDLNEGYYGKFDRVNHTVTHELFVHKDRDSSKKYNGLKCWWSGEHEAYWKDGLLRLAFLTDDKTFKATAVKWLDDILEHRGTDDYIGIYSSDSRFNHKGENGELWVQSRIMQALIAGYEFTGNTRYFEALKKAVDVTIQKLPNSYFRMQGKPEGGVSHGIGFFDPLYYLYGKTGDKKYSDFALRLYDDFNRSNVRDADLKTNVLLSPRGFGAHGAHISEGLYVPYFIAALSDDMNHKMAAPQTLKKLKKHLTPGGAMVCAEDVNNQPGTSDAGYEYCGIMEMIPSFTKIIALTGDMEAADLAEKMTLNAGQGARLPILKALSYVTTDNRKTIQEDGHGGRSACSAFHNAAACCVLNGGRLMPYYVEGMWMRDASKEGLTALLYGPCEVTTTIGAVSVSITEETSYPFSDEIVIKVTPKSPARFSLSFRIPEAAKGVSINGVPEADTSRKNRLLTVDRTWKAGDSFKLTMDFPVRKIEQAAGAKKSIPEYFLQRGPLVYALKLPAKFIELTNLNNSGFFRYKVNTENDTGWNYAMGNNAEFKWVSTGTDDILHPWANTPVSLKGTMVDENGKEVAVNFVPLGSTVLRRVTFPQTVLQANRRGNTGELRDDECTVSLNGAGLTAGACK